MGGSGRSAPVAGVLIGLAPLAGGRIRRSSDAGAAGPTGELCLDRPTEVATFDAIWQAVAGLTLDETESMRIVEASAKEYEND